MALGRPSVSADPELTDCLNWGKPVYEHDGHEHGAKVCCLAATKACSSSGFFKGAELADPEGFTENTRKNLRHGKVRDLSAILSQSSFSGVKVAVEFNLKA